jgi:NAD(P)-dependent dehydrogenase (short-subunit alcohol dehydrogenase family)
VVSAPVGFEGRVAVVTGGGRGLGRAYCLELARRGAAVVVNDVAPEHAGSVVTEIETMGGRATVSNDSVTTTDGAAAIIATAVDRFGTLDAVVNNAGFLRNAYFEDQTPAMLDAILDVHVRGAFFVTQAAWPIMRAKSYGRVVMTSSAGGMFAMQGEANYAAAKAGVFGLTKALAFEGRDLGVLVNAVLPHAATTISVNDPVPGHREHFKPGIAEALAPTRTVEAVAPLVAYLCSAACAVTGEAFAAGCGRFARVFVAETQGWTAPDASVSIEDVIQHLEEIRSQDRYHVPEHLYEELELFARARGWTAPA